MAYETQRIRHSQDAARRYGTNQDFLDDWKRQAALQTTPEDRRLLTQDLISQIANDRNLGIAWEHLRRRGGPAAGPDGLRYDDLHPSARWELIRLARRVLLRGDYRTAAPLLINKPKPGGGVRQICVFNTIDRVVHRAAVQILEPVFDPSFDPYSFGARPARGRLSALATLEALLLRTGRRRLVLVDFRAAFDSIPRTRLSRRLSAQIDDRAAVDLIDRIVASQPGRKGIPQGSPLSSFLMNYYADQVVDRPWRLRHPNDPLIRYVDNNALPVESDQHGTEIYQAFSRLVLPHGFVLKETREHAVRLLGTDLVEWLGFHLDWSDDGLICRLPPAWDEELRQSLLDCHERPDSGRCANEHIRGLVAECGPALASIAPRPLYDRIVAIADECEFREFVAFDLFALWHREALARWRRIRRKVQRDEGLITPEHRPTAPQPARTLLGTGVFDIYTDGCCLPGGIGGWACLVRLGRSEELLEYSGAIRRTSSGAAELKAVVRALTMTGEESVVRITTDSNYVRRAITSGLQRWPYRGWRNSRGKPLRNRRLLQQLLNLLTRRSVTCVWVAGHSGHPENERVDELARRVAVRSFRRSRAR